MHECRKWKLIKDLKRKLLGIKEGQTTSDGNLPFRRQAA
jgi:hypothetical protein